MILILPLAFITLFLYQWKKKEDDTFEAFSRTLILFAVLVLAITNFLSFFNSCTRIGIFVSWLFVCFVTATLYVTKFGLVLPDKKAGVKECFQNYFVKRPLMEKIMLSLGAVLCLVLFVGALFTVPHNYDSMTYHLGRVAHWIDQGSVNHFVTNIDRQLYSPVLAEYYLLHMMLLSGNDTFVNLLQYFSMIICALFLYKCARRLNTNRIFSVLAAFLFLMMPLTISQSVTTQNDLFAATFFAMFLYYFLWFIRREQLIFDKEEKGNLIRVGILVGLAYITKTSVCASMVMFVPWLVIVCLARKDKFSVLIKSALTALASLVVIISESLIRNFLSSGTIMPATASANIMVATKNICYIIVNILKNFALITTQHLSDALNGFICRIAIHVGAFLKVEVNHEAISFHGFDFITHMNRGDNMYSHDVTPSALVGYLALLCGVGVLVMLVWIFVCRIRKRETSKDFLLSLGFGISSWLSLGFIMALLRWQPWGTRLMYPALAMMVVTIANLAGLCLKKASKAVVQVSLGLLVFLAVVLAYPSVVYNMEPAMTNLSEGCSNRLERYFEHNDRYDTYMELAAYVKGLGVSDEEFTLGVNISGDGYDYPLWLVLKEELPQTTMQHLNFDAPELVTDAPEILLWVEKDWLEVGDMVEYGDVTYECVFVSTTENKDAVLIQTEK